MNPDNGISAPDPLEERTVASLRAGRLIGRRSWPPWLAWLIAALLLGAAVALALWTTDWSRPSAAQQGRTYLLAMYTGPDYHAPAPSDPSRYEEYVRWADRHREGDAVVLGGEDLGATVDAFGAPARPGDELSGYFWVRAENEADALRLAATSPHVVHGGTVVVREIEEHDPPSKR